MTDWILRFVKGLFIGSGFILPGVSGGALAAVFGVYERIISFLAHITRDFLKNAVFLIPVGLGLITGVFIFSFAISFLLEKYEYQIIWFFIGCIFGTIPTLWKQAGKKSRSLKHIFILLFCFCLSYLFMVYGESITGGNVPQNIFTWTMAGVLIGLGMIVPGLSPSNFLVYMGMYKDMAGGIKNLDFAVIIPIGLGVALSLLLLSKLMDFVFRKAYTGLFHGILGVVFASTIMIIPRNHKYSSPDILLCFVLCAAGTALGSWMCALEKKHKKA